MDSKTLYIVSTPIGNLKDITLRAVDVLKNVNVILSEDTRETSKLLDHYNILCRQLSYRDQNHKKMVGVVFKLLESGNNVALITDSGTPLISDPGFKLVKECLDKGYKVTSLPGPSAVISALVLSGLPTDKFTFLGFLPKSKRQRQNILAEYGKHDSTLIIYESPYKILDLLDEVFEILGDRYVSLVKEMTKVHEKIYRGYIKDIKEALKEKKLKGEYVLLISKKDFK